MNLTLRNFSFILTFLLLFWMLTGCETPPKDYTEFRKYHPESVLVLPPLNNSIDEMASYSYLSTVSKPLAEYGYYVFPVAVIDHFLKENGMPTPGEMHQIPLHKVDEIIGADAILYLTIEEYGTKYHVLETTTIVTARGHLVDVKTGEELWSDTVTHFVSSDSGGGGIIGMLASALVTQILHTATDAAHDVSAGTNQKMIMTSGQGFLYGPRHVNFQTEEF